MRLAGMHLLFVWMDMRKSDKGRGGIAEVDFSWCASMLYLWVSWRWETLSFDSCYLNKCMVLEIGVKQEKRKKIKNECKYCIEVRAF